MDIKQINSAIMLGTWTDIELRSMIDAVQWNRSQLAKQIKRSIMVGDQVEFTNSKTGRVIQGRVRKVAIKFVTVDTGATVWRVPANMLRVVDKVLA
jgi:putative ribosome biogenesis GTPase RsgA